jgi:hypothetical protein
MCPSCTTKICSMITGRNGSIRSSSLRQSPLRSRPQPGAGIYC